MPEKPEVKCPDCGGPTRLQSGRFGLFFGCVRFPECKGLQKANGSGQPVGTPAPFETRQLRRAIIEGVKSGEIDKARIPKPIGELDGDECLFVLRGFEPRTLWQHLMEGLDAEIEDQEAIGSVGCDLYDPD